MRKNINIKLLYLSCYQIASSIPLYFFASTRKNSSIIELNKRHFSGITKLIRVPLNLKQWQITNQFKSLIQILYAEKPKHPV